MVVVTDSSACLDPELVERVGIRVVPLHVIAAGQDLREGEDDLPRDLSAVTTSAPSPAELTETYSAALADSGGDGVVAIHISRHLSATWEAGRQAAQVLGEKVRIVDSCSAAMGLGYPVLMAARLAQAGGDLQAVYGKAVEVTGSGYGLIVVDRLDQLRRGGRIGTATALLGTALAMKPVLHLVDGRLVLREKTRTMTKALAKLVDCAVEQAGDVAAAVAVHHQQAPERAELVARQLRRRIPQVSELFVTEFTAVLAVHVGPGAIGVFVCPDGSGEGLSTPDE